MGKRVKRGLFQSKNGKLVNADGNGAANIMVKVVSDIYSYINEIEGSIVTPEMIPSIF